MTIRDPGITKRIMKLGATIQHYCGLRIDDPDAYIAECNRMGLRAAASPDHHLGGIDDLRRIKRAFASADIVISEIGGWSNCLDPRPAERKQAMATIAEALATADELGAVCCITLAGSLNEELAYGIDPQNFSDATFTAVADWIRQVLNEVRPKRTKLVIETTPWTPIDSIDQYERLLQAVDNDALAVHLDPVNFVTDARTYFDTGQLLNECFDRFGSRIVSCHAKDIRQLDPKTVQLEEVPPGEGVLDYRTFLRRARQLSTELPIVIEHLDTQQQYASAVEFLQKVEHSL